jgi:hypothetical protein
MISNSPKRDSQRSTNNRDRQAKADDRIAPIAECAFQSLTPRFRGLITIMDKRGSRGELLTLQQLMLDCQRRRG